MNKDDLRDFWEIYKPKIIFGAVLIVLATLAILYGKSS